MRKTAFRLWCKNRNEWETHPWQMTPEGSVIDTVHNQLMSRTTHILIQYLNMDDKNGNGIYEGYIVKGQFIHVFRYQLTVVADFKRFGAGMWGGYRPDTVEIIGNVYETEEVPCDNCKKPISIKQIGTGGGLCKECDKERGKGNVR